MSQPTRILLLLGTLLLGGCGPHILVEQDSTAGLPGNSHYAWGKATDSIPGENDTRINNDIITGKIKRAIDTGLARRGYKESSAEQADWLVHYHVGLQKQTQQVREPVFPPRTHVVCGPRRGCDTVYSWGYYGPPDTVTRTITYNEGTLLVDIHDARSNKLVWRGSLSNDVNLGKPLNEESLQKAIDELLLKLPAAPGIGK